MATEQEEEPTLMSMKRAHNRRAMAVSGSGRRFKEPERSPITVQRKRKTPNQKGSQRRTRLSKSDGAYVLQLYGELYPERAFQLGARVLHPRRGYVIAIGVEVRGSGGWDKLDYVLKPERGGRIFRAPVQDARGRGMRAVTADDTRYPNRRSRATA